MPFQYHLAFLYQFESEDVSTCLMSCHETNIGENHDLDDLGDSNSIVAIGKQRVICNDITDIGALEDGMG